LLRWEDWRRGSSLVLDWPSWLAAVSRYERAVAQLPTPSQPEAQLWGQALREVVEQLARVRARATVLGVDGAAGNPETASTQKNPPFAFTPTLGNEEFADWSGAGNGSFESFLKELRARYQRVRDQFPAADLQPLPGELPLEVAEDLRQLAEQRYRALLEPVRAEIRRQLYRLGEGRETLSAWRELVQRGWLSGAARRELADWLTVAHILQVWSGRTPSDPADALVQFVLQDTIPLPLGRLWLDWPGGRNQVGSTAGQPVQDGSPRAGVPKLQEPPIQLALTLLHREGRDTVLLYQRVDGSASAGKPPRRWEYRLTSPVSWPGECYPYRPGMAMRVQAQMRDTSGQVWQLTWSERECRSQVFGFTVLELTPRCHLPEQAPEEGPFLHEVRLHLSVPLPIPDLLP
jgi:hypothetical protein